MKHVKFLAQAGVIETPKWLDVVQRYGAWASPAPNGTPAPMTGLRCPFGSPQSLEPFAHTATAMQGAPGGRQAEWQEATCHQIPRGRPAGRLLRQASRGGAGFLPRRGHGESVGVIDVYARGRACGEAGRRMGGQVVGPLPFPGPSRARPLGECSRRLSVCSRHRHACRPTPRRPSWNRWTFLPSSRQRRGGL